MKALDKRMEIALSTGMEGGNLAVAGWSRFLNSMVMNSGNQLDSDLDAVFFRTNLEVFLSQPFGLAVSLFLLNQETYEFFHQSSFPDGPDPWAKNRFPQLVEQGIIAAALNSTQGVLAYSEPNHPQDYHLMILPLISPEEILGVIIVSLNRSLEFIDLEFLQLSLLQARQLALTIKNRSLTHQLKKNEELLRQKITGRTQNLEQAKRELKTILDSVKTGIVIIDKETHQITNANKTALEMMGHTREVILGSPCYSFCLRENETCPFSQSGLVGSQNHSESRLTKANGETIPILKTVIPVFLGGRSCLIESFVDISEQKDLENQFHQSQKLEAIGRLAGGVAHDFNNLLMAIMGYCDLTLNTLGKSHPTFHYVEEIEKAADRAASLTQQLLALSRRQVLQPKILDLNAVLSDIKKMLLRIIGEDIELISSLDPNLDHIKADKGQLEQVIMNLTVNARDAMPKGGKLLFETTNVTIDEGYHFRHPVVIPGPYVLLTVSDTGEGMDQETQSHIFEPFYTTKGVGKGTGLGLSTVYGIIKQSGGFIWVYSELGKGTTIKIFFPRTLESLGKPEKRSVPAIYPQGAETILLVEDESLLRTSIKKCLETNGYKVLDACTGDEALLISQRYPDPIHLVLTDVVMPGMNGRETAEYLLLIHPEARVLYMSGYTDDAVIRHGLLNEQTAFLQKPFTPKAMALRVREVLDLPKAAGPPPHRVPFGRQG